MVGGKPCMHDIMQEEQAKCVGKLKTTKERNRVSSRGYGKAATRARALGWSEAQVARAIAISSRLLLFYMCIAFVECMLHAHIYIYTHISMEVS